MKIIECSSGHYFDADKLESCPQCAAIAAGIGVRDLAGDNQSQIQTAAGTMSARSPHGRTVGWLVCLNGAMCGESFIVHEQENQIGRASNMDISLYAEPSVSREKHAEILYDQKKNSFFLRSGKKEGVLLNGKPVKNQRKLQDHDLITLGSCEILFVALCNEDFKWY